MKPAPFGYVRAVSVSEATRQLAAAGGEAKVIAGGQSLPPLLAMRLARPSLLVDINRIPGLAVMSRDAAGGLRFGALTRHRALAEQQAHPLLAEAARWIGHAAIRTRGTLGGSLAHADPSAELPAVALATGAAVHVAGPAGQREIPAGSLFTGPLQTSLGEDELIVAVDFPAPGRWGFAEFARRHGDFGVVIAVAAETGGEPVRACLMFAVQADGCSLITVEGLASGTGELHPLQQAFSDCHGLQCGFCTPGLLISALHLLRTSPAPGRAEIREALAGNICRCTGYGTVVDAVERAAAVLREQGAS